MRNASGSFTPGPNARRKVLNKAADALESKKDDFVSAMMGEIGATAGWAMFNLGLAAGMVREAAAITTQISGEVIPSDHEGTVAMALREPVPPTIFHTRASYAAEVQRIIVQMQSMGLSRIAVFYQNDPFGKDGLAAAEAGLKAAGMTLVATGAYEKGTTEVGEAVKAIHAGDPNGVIMVSNTAASAAFVKEMRTAGSFSLLMAVSVTAGPGVAKRIGNALARGLGVVQVVPKPDSGAVPISRELMEDLKRIKSDEPPNHTIMEGYLMAKVLVEGIRRAGENQRAAVIAALNTLGDFDAGGVRIRYSPTNHDGADYTDVSILDRSGKLLR